MKLIPVHGMYMFILYVVNFGSPREANGPIDSRMMKYVSSSLILLQRLLSQHHHQHKDPKTRQTDRQV